ncbi:hypothetical protein BIWAKO_06663 [Bosea sp. BIWAKO-01]|nr:hypothetical protein BIWAKO_06663 [Bosea sp. BIWAKO-01]
MPAAGETGLPNMPGIKATPGVEWRIAEFSLQPREYYASIYN